MGVNRTESWRRTCAERGLAKSAWTGSQSHSPLSPPISLGSQENRRGKERFLKLRPPPTVPGISRKKYPLWILFIQKPYGWANRSATLSQFTTFQKAAT